jgi:hypothetical protein
MSDFAGFARRFARLQDRLVSVVTFSAAVLASALFVPGGRSDDPGTTRRSSAANRVTRSEPQPDHLDQPRRRGATKSMNDRARCYAGSSRRATALPRAAR